MDESVPCVCPHGIRGLGILHGVNMGKGKVRLSTAPGCLRHDWKSHPFVPHVHKPWCVSSCKDMCHQCNGRKKDHPK